MSLFKKPKIKNSFDLFKLEKDDQGTKKENNYLKHSLEENKNYVQKILGNSNDIVFREIQIGKEESVKAGIFYTDGLADTDAIQHFVLEPIMLEIDFETDLSPSPTMNLLKVLKEQILTVGSIKDVTEYSSLFNSLLSGDLILLLDGHSQGFIISVRGWKERSVTEATSETVVRGPKEGFTECIRTNTALIRRKIKSPNLWMATKNIGEMTKTDVAIMYINGIANEKVVQEVHERLDRIDIDGILESGYIEELIQDKTYSPFPTIYYSERPDVISADLLEGKVAIIVDGSPNVLIVPALFVSFLQVAEDYYQRADISTLIRMLRFFSIMIALLAPSLYIAITTYHQEMIPTELLINLAAQREGVPFPAFIEALMMEVAFEILREAGLRMPRAIGSAISIVGTLVIGTAAVEAGIVSAAMVIVVAITAISSFILPSVAMSMSLRVLRFPMMGLAASFGLVGILVGLISLILHMCSLRSFGIPYMSPLGPLIPQDLKDTIIRVPWWGMFSRPRLISQKNISREHNSAPKPPQDKI
ncbi:spore germination protein [Neobacillus sp. KR4-4]|uniref:spore germination protein n=1 Tax=Neobacillus sp. KR4-4 TaxID=3344872 RepID=UPI0035CC572A